MTLTVPNSVYAERRARLAAQLGPDGIAIVPTAPERMRNRDSDFLYRHDSYFYYLTGFTEPGACLVLTQDGQSTLFCNPKDPEREIWDGYRLGPEAATGALGVDRAHSAAELDQRLPRLLDAMVDERLDQRVCEFHREFLPLETSDQLVRLAVPREVAIASFPDPGVQRLAP